MRYLFHPEPARRRRLLAAILAGVILGTFLAMRDAAQAHECPAPKRPAARTHFI